MDHEKILQIARGVLQDELEGIKNLKDTLGEDFLKVIELILEKRGRIIVTGVGKSGLIAQKIAATLTSVGTPAIFLHPTESLHGDLGIVDREDMVIAVSKSGESDEFNLLIPLLKQWGLPIITITADPSSELAQNSDMVIDIGIKKEACPYDLVPTVSTTVSMALGDALAIVLLYLKNFQLEDFASLHPGGAIGKRFWYKVSDVMLTGREHVPVVRQDTGMKEVILEMTTKRGITSVVDEEGRVVGIITDGDLRRLLERESDPFPLKACQVMSKNPKLITKEELAAKAAQKMGMYGVTALIVVDEEKYPIGIVHLHDLMRERVV